jgi:hypothetical protein
MPEETASQACAGPPIDLRPAKNHTRKPSPGSEVDRSIPKARRSALSCVGIHCQIGSGPGWRTPLPPLSPPEPSSGASSASPKLRRLASADSQSSPELAVHAGGLRWEQCQDAPLLRGHCPPPLGLPDSADQVNAFTGMPLPSRPLEKARIPPAEAGTPYRAANPTSRFKAPRLPAQTHPECG